MFAVSAPLLLASAYKSGPPAEDIPGVSGSGCGETCLTSLYSLEDLTDVSDYSFTTVYLNPAGNDSLAGTSAGTAWQTPDRVSDEFVSIGGCGLEVVLVDGGTWDDDAEWGPGCATGAANCGWDSIVPTCTDRDRPALYVHSAGSNEVTFDATGLTNQPGDLGVCGYSNPGAGVDGGWVVFEDVNCTVAGASAFRVGLSGKLLLLNSHGNSAPTFIHNAVTSHTGDVVAINWSASGGSIQGIMWTDGPGGHARATSISNGTFLVNDSGLAGMGLRNEADAETAFIGGNIVVGSAALSGTGVLVEADALTVSAFNRPRVWMARTAIDLQITGVAGTTGGVIVNTTSGRNGDPRFIGNQVTVTASGDDQDLLAIWNDSGTTTNQLLQCSDCVLGEYNGTGRAIWVEGSAPNHILTGRVLVDSAELTNSFQVGDTTYETAAALEAGALSTWSVGFTETDTAVQWGANYSCDMANECHESANISYCIPFPTPIPRWVLGTVHNLSQFCTSASDQDAGAR